MKVIASFLFKASLDHIRNKRWLHLKQRHYRRYLSTEPAIRVRFAPSPTGLIHLGGLRTALYNYLFSKSLRGTFIIRIEDTDRNRIVEGAAEKVEEDLHWAGIEADESPKKGGDFGPYYQSQRLPLYQKEAERLVSNGRAYYCFCTERRLDLLRREALRRREVPKYDNKCRHLTQEEVDDKLNKGLEHCIRFKLKEYTKPFHDIVYGPIVHNVVKVEGDPVIMKSDGYPTYHLANVVDDHYMQISHVLRGVEWQPSTTKHLLLYEALGWKSPEFAHLPLLLNEDGTKLSKRQKNMTLEAYRASGIYPLAVINFVVSCGGGFAGVNAGGGVGKCRSLDHLASQFLLNLVNSHSCQVSNEKLDEFNREELLKLLSKEETLREQVGKLLEIIKEKFKDESVDENILDEEYAKRILLWSSAERAAKLTDLVQPRFEFLWRQPQTFHLADYNDKYFEELSHFIVDVENREFTDDFFANYFKTFARERGLQFGPFMIFLRVCISGMKSGPSIKEMMTILGKENVLKRLKRSRHLKLKISQEEKISNLVCD